VTAASLVAQWRADLESWAIPAHITAAVTESPWVLPTGTFARRADRAAAHPSGPSFERAWAALDPPGSVLDVGAGAGAACLPLIPRMTSLTAVDVDEQMLALLAGRASALGRDAALIAGRWPAVAAHVPPADVVTCYHVLYNVPDIEPFIAELTGHARRLVVAEITATHPLTPLNPFWQAFHGLERPDRPTATQVLDILGALGLRPVQQRWIRPEGPEYASFAELADVTRRRLCLPPRRTDEVAEALIGAGIDPAHPRDLGSAGREVVTIWWDGAAPG
jgi:SAM-dependent methyltransferase